VDLLNQRDLLVGIYRELGTSLSLEAARKLAAGDWEWVARIPAPNPRLFATPQAFFTEAQTSALCRKVKVDIPGIDRLAPTIRKWYEGEAACYKSNERLSALRSGRLTTPADSEALLEFFSNVRKKIASWIGHAPPGLDSLSTRHGPGATFSDKGRLTTLADKMSGSPTLTRDVGWFLLDWMGTAWAASCRSSRRAAKVVRGNRFTTAPKTALIDRAIAIEPSINIFYQLAMGNAIRERLRASTGWDLNHAQEIHRFMAKEASISKQFCTIDLSNASDTVSTELVRLCLPPAWFQGLDALRSKETLLPAHKLGDQKRSSGWCKLEKFSSMGNGFTFELETILFAALAETYLEKVRPSDPLRTPSICERDEFGYTHLKGKARVPTRLGTSLFVFGDDIILPDDECVGFTAVLNFCGFSVNLEKSFWGDNPFRESCGADFFQGVDVRPIFVKDLPDDDPWKSIPLANSSRGALEKLKAFTGRSHLGPWHRFVSGLPPELRRCRGPEHLGDAVIHDSPTRWVVRYRGGMGEIRTVSQGLQPIPWIHWRPDVRLVCRTYGLKDASEGITPRDAKRRPNVRWTSYG